MKPPFSCNILIIGLFKAITGLGFNKEFVGVGYGPYTKQWVGKTLDEWSAYTQAQVHCQLQLMSTKFSTISTYNFGTSDSVTIHIPKIAAQINKEKNAPVLKIFQGIHQLKDRALQEAELFNAIKAANESNQIYPGTVTALTFNWEDHSLEEGRKILEMLAYTRNKFGLKVGARAQNCEIALSSNPDREILEMLSQIVQNSDYIMCNIYPTYQSSIISVEAAVQNVAEVYSAIRGKALSVNPQVEVIIGETGWPSEGVSFNGSPSSIPNMVTFWELIAQRATDAKVRVQMFEGIDEPWKSNQNNLDPKNAEGYMGGEGHYGWWYQLDNQQECTFVEKSTGIKSSGRYKIKR